MFRPLTYLPELTRTAYSLRVEHGRLQAVTPTPAPPAPIGPDLVERPVNTEVRGTRPLATPGTLRHMPLPPPPCANGDTPDPHPFHAWVDRELARRRNAGEEPSSWSALGRAMNTNEAVFTRWKSREIKPSIRMVRRVADALGVPVGERLRLMVVAEVLEPDEVRCEVVVKDPDLLTDDEVWEQVDKRFRHQ